MKYSKALPFKQALNASQVKTLLPTDFTSAQLQQLRGDILERGRFSARVRSVQHLDVIDQGINDLVAGATDLATQRLAVKRFVQGTGYMAPEDKRGGLQDLASDARINLQLRIGTQQAQGAGWWQQGQDADLLYAFPARAFVRVEAREKPRDNWPQRWNEARANTVTDGATDSASGEMVALEGHPIWIALSVFKTPYEPFDFGSGMGREDVDRTRTIALGLMSESTVIFPQSRPFNQDLKASPEVRSSRLRSLLESTGIGRFDQDGVFVFTGGGGA
ncbi:MAG: hypothetical protein NTV51_12240 [Verrucomicrobia bacterium]|nr:hypothetical protein [Verrucomicrobiota bacterium]